jgi:predicted nucleic acid-binding protein
VKVLDASVLIASFDPDDAHHANAEARLTQDLEATWGINTLILAEVLAGPGRPAWDGTARCSTPSETWG